MNPLTETINRLDEELAALEVERQALTGEWKDALLERGAPYDRNFTTPRVEEIKTEIDRIDGASHYLRDALNNINHARIAYENSIKARQGVAIQH